MKKSLLLCCSVIPLILQIPYLVSAWSNSRLDRWDWVFYLLATAAFFPVFQKNRIGKSDCSALFLLLPALFLALTPFYHNVNALAAASSVVCIFAAAWLIASWQFACCLLPATVILLLGTPSSSYGISLLTMTPVRIAWLIKFALALLCFAWIFCNEYFNLQIKKGTLCFTAALIGSCLLLLHSREIYFEGRSFIPEFTGHTGDFWGRTIEPDENTKRFFVSSTVRQYRYIKNDVDISVLEVRCGSDIHEIHPASHCLRTSFWTVTSEKILYLQDNFAVTEIDARKGNKRYLTWVWYSSDKFSTPGFLGFRRHFRSGGNYYTYQISAPVYKDVEQSRTELQKFIQVLKPKRILQ